MAEARKGDKKMKGKRVFRFDLIDFDYYDEEKDKLIHSSDSMEEIEKAAKEYIEKIGGLKGENKMVVADWDSRRITELKI